MTGVAACLFFGAPFCAVFYGVGRPNFYVPRQHIPSIIQAIVPAMPDWSFVLCVFTGDGDPEGSNPRDIRVRARGGDTLPSPGVNPLEGSTKCSCKKLGFGRRFRLPAL